ncbi:protein C9orf135-like protein [Huso huso]|uniref:Protein C9orf135-like protein n=1 Tax=Huso huso TaxID=61971 RepID=A0ABR1A7E8_HUSHU
MTLVNERKGSLLLRSDHMDYSRPILVSNWHKNREAEPKDYDVTLHPTGEKDLHQSTYKHFANALAYSWDTTTKDLQSQFHLKKYYKVKETPKPMLNADNFHMANFNRETCWPKTGFEAVLPSHHPDHCKIDMTTTYSIEYQSPYYCRTPPPEPPDYSRAYKRCHSQFTDTADCRRNGRNTWQDESGVYANRGIKSKVFQPRSPITPHE